MIAALLVAAVTRLAAAGGMTQVVSPVAAATVISEDGANLDLLVIWRGQPGWYRGGGQRSGSGGGSGRTFHSSEIFGAVQLDVEFDFASRRAVVGGHRVSVGANDVVLVDRIETGKLEIVRLLSIDRKLPDAYPDIFPLLARSPDIVSYLRCDTRLDGPLEALSDWCAPLFVAGAPTPTPEMEVRAALARYADLSRRMDHAAIAAMFAPDGEIVNPGQPPVHGPAAIDAFLLRFEAYKVVSDVLKADATIVNGDRATQSGVFRQLVRGPDGSMITASGTFAVDWIHIDGAWRVLRMATTPNR